MFYTLSLVCEWFPYLVIAGTVIVAACLVGIVYLLLVTIEGWITHLTDLHGVIWNETKARILESREEVYVDDMIGKPYFAGTKYSIEVAGTVTQIFIPHQHAATGVLPIRFAFGRSGQIYVKPLST